MHKKTSIHIQPSNIQSLLHNCRVITPEYTVESASENEYDCTADEAVATFYELAAEARENYMNRTKQKIQTSSKRLVWEAVLTINEHHTLKDIKKLAKEFEKRFGWRPIHISIHKDEGHISKENGKTIINYHAHILFFMLSRDGIYLMKKRDNGKKKMALLQTLTANVLGMERGIPKIITGTERLNHWQYRKVMEMKNKFLLKIKNLTQTIEKAKAILHEKNVKIKKLEKNLYNTKEQAITISVENVKLKAKLLLLQEDLNIVSGATKITIPSTLYPE
jgi:hypothetical protein